MEPWARSFSCATTVSPLPCGCCCSLLQYPNISANFCGNDVLLFVFFDGYFFQLFVFGGFDRLRRLLTRWLDMYARITWTWHNGKNAAGNVFAEGYSYGDVRIPCSIVFLTNPVFYFCFIDFGSVSSVQMCGGAEKSLTATLLCTATTVVLL